MCGAALAIACAIVASACGGADMTAAGAAAPHQTKGTGVGGNPDATSSSAAAPANGTVGAGSAKNPAMETAPWRSGKRLRARVLDGGGGALRFLGWHDTQLDVDCSFLLAADGKLRCLPGEESGAVYSDAACTQLFVPELGDAADRYRRIAPPNDGLCSNPDPFTAEIAAQWDVVTLGAAQTLARYFFPSSDSSAPATTTCAGVDVAGNGYSGHLADPAPPETFVAAQEKTTTEMPLGARIISAEDDSEEIPWLVDQARGAPCAPGELPGVPTPLCLPNPLLSVPVNDTSACQNVTSMADGQMAMRMHGCPAIPAPAVILTAAVDSCNVPSTSVLDASPTSCGAAFDLSRLVPLAVRESGSGRLRARAVTTAAGQAAHASLSPLQGLEQGDFFDSERNERCNVQDTADGAKRCLPVSAQRGDLTYFSDPACSVPVAIFAAMAGCAMPRPLIATPGPPITSDLPPPPTPPVDALYQAGDTPMPGTIYVISGKGGGCTDSLLTDREFMMLPLQKLDLGSFPVVTEHLE